jgi:RNA polymerase sigma-70 factor, ECF subfamily
LCDDRGHGVSNRLGILPREEDGVVSKGRAFLSLFLKAERRIFAYILTLLPQLADAEDVLQEASAIMWEKFDEYDPPEDFVAWGCRIAYYRIQHHRRDRQRHPVVFSEAMLERVASIVAEEATVLQLNERHEALARCLGKLSQRDRDLLARRFKEGATPRSIAKSVGRSIDAVYKALAKVRKALYDCVERTLAAEGRP